MGAGVGSGKQYCASEGRARRPCNVRSGLIYLHATYGIWKDNTSVVSDDIVNIKNLPANNQLSAEHRSGSNEPVRA